MKIQNPFRKTPAVPTVTVQPQLDLVNVPKLEGIDTTAIECQVGKTPPPGLRANYAQASALLETGLRPKVKEYDQVCDRAHEEKQEDRRARGERAAALRPLIDAAKSAVKSVQDRLGDGSSTEKEKRTGLYGEAADLVAEFDACCTHAGLGNVAPNTKAFNDAILKGEGRPVGNAKIWDFLGRSGKTIWAWATSTIMWALILVFGGISGIMLSLGALALTNQASHRDLSSKDGFELSIIGLIIAASGPAVITALGWALSHFTQLKVKALDEENGEKKDEMMRTARNGLRGCLAAYGLTSSVEGFGLWRVQEFAKLITTAIGKGLYVPPLPVFIGFAMAFSGTFMLLKWAVSDKGARAKSLFAQRKNDEQVIKGWLKANPGGREAQILLGQYLKLQANIAKIEAEELQPAEAKLKALDEELRWAEGQAEMKPKTAEDLVRLRKEAEEIKDQIMTLVMVQAAPAGEAQSLEEWAKQQDDH